MAVRIKPLDAGREIGAEVEGVDIGGELSPEEVAAIELGMDRHAVLAFRGQPLTDEQQIRFSGYFGRLEATFGGNVRRADQHRLSKEFADVSNLDHTGKLLQADDRNRMFNLGNTLWHSDSSFRATPAKYSLLSGRAIPAKGPNTEFADMRAAYDALDEETKREVESLVCRHSLMYSRGLLGFTEFSEEEKAKFAPVRQRLVRVHPVTRRKSLFLASHIGAVEGWPMPYARAYIRDLIERATQPRFVYVHKWRQDDLVMWDNRQTMHRVRLFKDTAYVRDVRRTTVAGDAPTIEQERAA
jgi:alpha-ketoglutarate-dependent 2,4-dichlorophenoxyacetate dioxygenase